MKEAFSPVLFYTALPEINFFFKVAGSIGVVIPVNAHSYIRQQHQCLHVLVTCSSAEAHLFAFFSAMHHFAGSLSSCDALTCPDLSPLPSVPLGKLPVSTNFFSSTCGPD